MYLAIWTAFKAAPFNRLSDTTQKFKILLLDKPSLNLETNTSSLPSTSNGVGSGLSQYSVPSNPLIDDLCKRILDDFKLNDKDQVCIMINSLGATPLEELYIISKRVNENLSKLKIVIIILWILSLKIF